LGHTSPRNHENNLESAVLSGINRRVTDFGERESFFSFVASATLAAVNFAAFVATPGLREINAQFGALNDDSGFVSL
jgi:hypothetical protein